VVQQRGGVALKGGVGQVGDEFERNADAVADRVVAGHSSEALLDPYAGGQKSANPPSDAPVQRLILPFGAPTSDDGDATDAEATLAHALEAMQSVQQGDLSNIEPGHEVVDPKTKGCLSNIGPNETLYILGHGSGETVHKMSPGELAKTLRRLKLPKIYRGKIVLVSCHAGELQTSGDLKDTTYAAKLQGHLAKKGILVPIQAPKGVAKVWKDGDGPAQIRSYPSGRDGAEAVRRVNAINDRTQRTREAFETKLQTKLDALKQRTAEAIDTITPLAKRNSELDTTIHELNEGMEELWSSLTALPGLEAASNWPELTEKAKALAEGADDQAAKVKKALAARESLLKRKKEALAEKRKNKETIAELEKLLESKSASYKERAASTLEESKRMTKSVEQCLREALLPVQDGLISLPAPQEESKAKK
jgi:hypothetical protein